VKAGVQVGLSRLSALSQRGWARPSRLFTLGASALCEGCRRVGGAEGEVTGEVAARRSLDNRWAGGQAAVQRGEHAGEMGPSSLMTTPSPWYWRWTSIEGAAEPFGWTLRRRVAQCSSDEPRDRLSVSRMHHGRSQEIASVTLEAIWGSVVTGAAPLESDETVVALDHHRHFRLGAGVGEAGRTAGGTIGRNLVGTR
jgi:hypothetical protein